MRTGPEQVWPKEAVRAVAATEGGHDFEEGFIGHVLGVGFVARQAVGESERGVVVCAVEEVDGIGVTRTAVTNEVFVRGFRCAVKADLATSLSLPVRSCRAGIDLVPSTAAAHYPDATGVGGISALTPFRMHHGGQRSARQDHGGPEGGFKSVRRGPGSIGVCVILRFGFPWPCWLANTASRRPVNVESASRGQAASMCLNAVV